MTTWNYIDSGPNIGAYNMALDEELLARAQAGDSLPVFRLYTWSPPAVSIGRFQNKALSVNEDACRKYGFDIVRRITGGRAVLHRNELTYSVVARTDDPFFPPTVLGTYKVIAAGLVAGLRSLGLDATMVTRTGRQAALVRKKAKEAACFSSPSWYEIVVNDRKIVGSAQRRAGKALLQHGSILIDYDPVLESEVIPGGCPGDVVTSLAREFAGKLPPLKELQSAILGGFAEALRISFR